MAQMKLQDKVAIITGGAGGVGSATAALFTLHGAYVIIADTNDKVGKKVAQEMGATGRVLFKHCDVSEEADVAATVNFAMEKFGKLDIMYNNAGVASPLDTFQDLDMDLYDRCTAVNVRGVVMGIKHAARVMVPRKQGIILNTGSMASVATGGTIKLIYNMNKMNLPGITKVAAYHLGKHGIRVNCISPSGIPTEMIVTWHKQFANETVDMDMVEKAFLGCSPLDGSICTREHVAKGALFLCSDDSGYVSGQNLVIDAGYTNIVDYDPMGLRKKLKPGNSSDCGSSSIQSADIAESDHGDDQSEQSCLPTPSPSNSKSKALVDSVNKLIELLKEDSSRRNLHKEEFMKWERENSEEHRAWERQFKEKQLNLIKEQTEVERKQAESFNLLAQAMNSLVQKSMCLWTVQI